MSQIDQDEQLTEGGIDAQDIAEGKYLIALQEETQSKSRGYRNIFKKMAIAAAQSAGEELLASWLANDRTKHGNYFSSRVPKRAVYGALIRIPVTNWLFKMSRYLFRGRTSPTSRLLAILFGLFVIAPIQKIIDMSVGGIIAGARTWYQVRATVRAGFLPVMKVLLLAYPIAAAFASNFLLEKAWPKFFAIVNMAINIYNNAHVKKKRIEALRRRYYNGPADANEDGIESDGDSIDTPDPRDHSNEQQGIDIPSLSALRGHLQSHNGPSYTIYPVVGQLDDPLSPSPFFQPAPMRPYRGSSFMSGLESGEGIDESAAEQEGIETPVEMAHFNTLKMFNSSDTGEEFGGPATREEDTESDRKTTSTESYFTQRSFGNSDAEGEESVSATTLPTAAATAAESIGPVHDCVDDWSTAGALYNSSDSDKEEELASDIDSDTSSELPRYRWTKRYRRRPYV